MLNDGRGVTALTGLKQRFPVDHYKTRNELGQTVVNHGGRLTNDDGTLHKAYKAAPGTYLSSLIKKQKKGFPLTSSERKEIMHFWASNPTAGLANVSQLGGRRGGGALKNPGTFGDAPNRTAWATHR